MKYNYWILVVFFTETSINDKQRQYIYEIIGTIIFYNFIVILQYITMMWVSCCNSD